MRGKEDNPTRTFRDTIVIGGGQAGLVTGYFLKQLKEDFLILDAQENTGDAWRNRWDSLRLFTPSWLNGLPGMPFPGAGDRFPAKDEVADFLLSYKERFDLPVRYHCEVTGLFKIPGGYEVRTRIGILFAKSVVVATGNYSIPKIPAFGRKLDDAIEQIHSSSYSNPSGLPAGDVLVVGAGTSALQIAMDLVRAGRKVYVSGTPTFHIPDLIFTHFEKQFIWFATHILNTSTPMGRKAQKAFKKGKGAPLINISIDDIKKAGIKHIPRITGTREGLPSLDNGDLIKVANVIWATGFSPDYSWVHLDGCFDEKGYPLTMRGISTVTEGLYFVGSLFQFGLTSTWLAGVGRDAEFVCRDVQRFNRKTRVAVKLQTAGDDDPYASRK